MEWSVTALTGLMLVLCPANGQNTTDSQTTLLPSADTSNINATTTIIPTVPSPTTNVTPGSPADNATETPATLSRSPSQSTSDVLPTTGLSTTDSLFNTTLSSTQNLTYITPRSTNTTSNTSISNPSFVRGSCSQNPPLCCLRQNNTCNRGGNCYCDVYCLRSKDCCPDFISTCITGFQNASSLPSASNTTNTTTAPESPSPFPLLSFPGFGQCSAAPVLCCENTDVTCFRGCFCDQSCVAFNDCCSDYNQTCADVKTVFSNAMLSILAPPTSDDASVQEAIRQSFVQLEAELKNTYGAVRSVRILKITKT